MKVKTSIIINVILLFCTNLLYLIATTHAQTPIHKVRITDPAVIAASTPAPLYRDPVFDGAAELDVIDGRLVCDRDKPFRMELP